MVKKAAQATPNEQLRRLRQERGWTQKDVANRIGAPLDLNVTRWERGTSTPSAYYVQKLCELFGKSPGELGLLPTVPVAEDVGRAAPESPARSKDLPTGTVTLLFTDIEGSTHLLHQLGDDYANLLTEHGRLLRMISRQWNGCEVDTQGDSFFLAFARANDAVEAALAIQRALAKQSWPHHVTVRVRIGLHTGEPQLSQDGYIGMDVHQAARIMNAGHGGQVLLSHTTYNLVEQHLPEGAYLKDLGEHRLKDLQRPIHLFQLGAEDLPGDFPPLRTLNYRPNNLPIQPTSLIGREKEVEKVCALLRRPEVRLLTLMGPGGVGKTRLGLQVAADLSELFSDGVFVVPLAPVSDPEQVVPMIAQTLSISEASGQPLLTLVKSVLKEKNLLLLLDNFEQVADAALQVSDLLSACPSLKVIVTSRVALHVRGEQEFVVPPLSVPDPKHLPDLATLTQYYAVELFIARAQAARLDFELTEANAPAVAGICARLDGLPLAIELAAARVKYFSPHALLTRLEQGLAFLTGGARDLPERHQTLRGTIAWSYELLSPAEQALFRRLAIFVDGCSIEAAEQVSNALGGPADDVLETLFSLVDKSLLRQVEQEGGEGEARFWMLQVLREFGLESLESTQELEATRDAHASYFLEQAEEAEPHLRGTEPGRWFAQLEQEHENLLAALTWLLERAGASAGDEGERTWAERAMRLSGALYWFWNIHGYYREGRSYLERALSMRAEVPVAVQVKVLYAAIEMAINQDDFQRAEALCRGSLALSHELEANEYKASILFQLGFVSWARCRYAEACDQFEEAAALFQRLGDRWNYARCLAYMARALAAQGDYEQARDQAEASLQLSRRLENQGRMAIALSELARIRFLADGDLAASQALGEQSLELLRELGDTQYIAYLGSFLGELRLRRGEQAQARALVEQSVTTLKDLGDRWGTGEALLILARIAASEGKLAEAKASYQESLALTQQIDAKNLIASALEGMGAVAAAQGEPGWAARLWGVAQELRETIGAPLPPVYREEYERALASARAQAGEEVFANALAQGRALTVEQVLASYNI